MNNSASNQKTLGVVLVVLGVLFLLGSAGGWGARILEWGWPLWIVLPGVALLFSAFLGGKTSANNAVPGAIVTTVGLILLYQSITNHWESWAYAWALIPAAGGLGAFIKGVLSDDAKIRDSGWKATLTGLLMFVGFGAFFELFVFHNIPLPRFTLPILLIGAGLYYIFLAPTNFKSTSVPDQSTRANPPIEGPNSGSDQPL